MSTPHTEYWLDEVLPRQTRLTQAIVTITENILRANQIEYLAVTGRTKSRQAAVEKIKRKNYASPRTQLTDMSGVRIVVYFESDVRRVSELIESTFEIDKKNSLNKDDLLSPNQIGYRSVHFVCTLGKERDVLPEFCGLGGLQFEFQVRTVLQHAWAELAHDRNYKFSGKLPRDLERKLYLYAGILEVADKGFNELSRDIDQYATDIKSRTMHGDLNIEVTSLSLDAFVNLWAVKNKITLNDAAFQKDLGELIRELNQFGIHTLGELNDIIPKNYSEFVFRECDRTTIYGAVRDWMLLSDWRRFKRDVAFNWFLDSKKPFDRVFDAQELREFSEAFNFEWSSSYHVTEFDDTLEG